MSASYPLVRNRYAFSTRLGVSTSPSRDGSSPNSASSRLIRSCILLFYIPALLAQTPADRLYADRATLASARQAADVWSRAIAGNPHDFESAWKLARADYWLGGHAPEAERRTFLEQGIEAGRKASAIEPHKPDGYFWMAANMGALAESFGVRQGIKYRTAVRDALETALKIDAAYQQGSPDRALGRWYFKVPHLFGGDRRLAEQHLRASLAYDPESTASHFFLAELLLDDGRKADGRAELQRVIDAPINPAWAPEDREF